MIHLACKKLRHTKPRFSTFVNGYLLSAPPSHKTASNTSNSREPHSLAVFHLVKSRGLSSKSAVSAELLDSRGITQTHIRNLRTSRAVMPLADPCKTPKCNVELFSSLGLSGARFAVVLQKEPEILESPNAKLVVELFANYGFSKEQIASMVFRVPQIFAYDPQKTLNPKLDFLQSAGFSALQVVKLLHRDPFILRGSLENQILCSVRVLKQIVRTDEIVVKAVMAYPRLLKIGLEKQFVPNVTALISTTGVPEFNVVKMIQFGSMSLCHSTEKFSKIVRDVTELGFDPTTLMFLLAVHSFVLQKESLLEQKIQVFSSFGLSRNEFFKAFRLQPMFSWTSVKKLREVIDFFVSKLHFEPSNIPKHPGLFLHSLEKRIIPRCSTLNILISKDLVKRDICLVYLFKLPEKTFVKNFVTKHQQTVPEVVEAHRGEIEFQGFDIDQKALAIH
ncbi:hypothetical protein RJ640_030348 [Escallonia rubra]|uniref:Uncharacterized protein n=1 Tax=Escallonia rubra TaxID=112253 RepID=A0AA88QMV2_9ASTE|nr:hypothetical protein RJ640_030348 [Escallonia rubra]